MLLLLFESTILKVLREPQSGKFSGTFLCSRLPPPAVQLCTCCARLLFPQSPRCHPQSPGHSFCFLQLPLPPRAGWDGLTLETDSSPFKNTHKQKLQDEDCRVSVPALLRELRVLVTGGPASRAELSGRRRAALRRAAQGARLRPEEQKVAVVASGLGDGPGQRPGQGSKHPVRGRPSSRTDSAGRGSSSLPLGPSLEKSRPSDVSRTATALPGRLVRCHIRPAGKSHRGRSNTPCSEATEDRKPATFPNRTTSQVAKAGGRRAARPSPSIVGLVVQAGALASGYGSHRTTFPRTPRAALGPGPANHTSRRTPGGPLADAGSWHQGAAPLP